MLHNSFCPLNHFAFLVIPVDFVLFLMVYMAIDKISQVYQRHCKIMYLRQIACHPFQKQRHGWFIADFIYKIFTSSGVEPFPQVKEPIIIGSKREGSGIVPDPIRYSSTSMAFHLIRSFFNQFCYFLCVSTKTCIAY